MSTSTAFPLVAVDVGNSRIKLGAFAAFDNRALPHPEATTMLELNWADSDLAGWLASEVTTHNWCIASVNRPAANRLVEWLAQRGIRRVHRLKHEDMPLSIDVAHPETVGIDRLADAVAANRLRDPNEPAIVVDHGSAITVNLLSREGVFRGGAILPGTRMTARALHEFTDGLPLVEVTDAPQVLERSTKGAIRFGLYWGSVGAVREVIRRIAPDGPEPQVFLTGGGAPALAAILGEGRDRPPQFVPHLTLAGVALAAVHLAAKGQR
jgi:type III pantothenate kinase